VEKSSSKDTRPGPQTFYEDPRFFIVVGLVAVLFIGLIVQIVSKCTCPDDEEPARSSRGRSSAAVAPTNGHSSTAARRVRCLHKMTSS